jgi:glycerate kinase
VGIARRSKALGVPTLLLAGSLGQGYDALYQHGIDAIIPIAEEPTTLESSLQNGAELLERAAERAVRLYALGRSG